MQIHIPGYRLEVGVDGISAKNCIIHHTIFSTGDTGISRRVEAV